MNIILFLLFLIIVLYIFKKSNFSTQTQNVPPPDPSSLTDNTAVTNTNKLINDILKQIKTITDDLKKNDELNAKLNSAITMCNLNRTKLIKKIDADKINEAKKGNKTKSENQKKLEKDLITTDTFLKELNDTKKGNDNIPKTSNDQINVLLNKICEYNNVLFKGTVEKNKFFYTIQCLSNIKDGMYLSGVGGNLSFHKTPFQWKIVKNKDVFSIQSLSDSNYLNNQSPNKLVFLGSKNPKTQASAPASAPVKIDLFNITGTYNLGSIRVKNEVLEYKRDNYRGNNNGDLAIPYKVSKQKTYKITIVTGNIKAGTRMVIQSLNSKIYDAKNNKPIKDEKISANPNATITFIMVPTKDTSAYYIKITIPNQNDVLIIKSINIQEIPEIPGLNYIPPPAPVTIDLAKITGGYNFGSIGVRNGVLEYRRGNYNGDKNGQLVIPYKVSKLKTYTITIVTGNIKTGIAIISQLSKNYDKDNKPIKDSKILSNPNATITYNMVPDNDSDAYRILINMPDQNDVFIIKSLTIQEIPQTPESSSPYNIWTIKDAGASGRAFSISTSGNYLDGQKLELVNNTNNLTSLWTINTMVTRTMGA